MRATSILNPRFKYVNAVSTDIRKTFRRARKEMKMQKDATENILRTTFPGIYFPLPSNIDDIEYQQCLKLMHQDVENQYPWSL